MIAEAAQLNEGGLFLLPILRGGDYDVVSSLLKVRCSTYYICLRVVSKAVVKVLRTS